MLLPSLVGMLLSCKLDFMQPTNYLATLKLSGKDTYELVLTYQYYGAGFDYKYSLKKTQLGLEGQDKRKDKVLVRNVKKVKENYSLVIDSQNEGQLGMICELKKI